MFQKSLILCFFICSTSIAFSQRYLTEIFSEVQVDTSITYGRNIDVLSIFVTGAPETIDLKMDIYTPVGDTETNRPFILYLHDSNFLPQYLNGSCLGTKRDLAAVEICTRLAKMGYVAASIDYRQGWNPVAASIDELASTLVQAIYRGMQDARTGLRFFRKTEAEDGNPYGIDPQRAIIWGDGSGGTVALAAATLNDPSELIAPNLFFSDGTPYIVEAVHGDIYGTSLGLSSPTDTLSLPNHVGYSSEFNMSTNASGYLLLDDWLDAGEMPMISFHGIDDILYPYDDQILIIPTSGQLIIQTYGSQIVQELANDYGNNQVFEEANIQDGFTDAANDLNEGLEGLFPFILNTQVNTPPFNLITMPWNWVTETPPPSPGGYPYYNCNFDENAALSKIDTLVGYFAPRAFAALCFGCQEFNANVFLDENNNGVFDGIDFPVSNVVAEFQPGDLHANTNENGDLSKLLPEGDYTMTITPPMYHEVTTTDYPVEFSIDAAGVSPNNVPISIVPMPGINDLQVSLLPLEAPMPGFEMALKIVYKNQGTTTQSGTVTLNFDEHFSLLESTPLGNVNGTEITWQTDDLAPFETEEIFLTFEVSTDTELGEVLLSDVSFQSMATDETPTDNVDQIQQIVIGSFDPNDKAVNPPNLPADETENRYLTYLIRFQNTGTAPAVNIRIEDTLSQFLNINTLEVLDVSHDYRMEITGERNIAWFFDDIFLPDSTNNEPESHGHIAFRIETDLPVDLPNSIDNQAFIYFDFNEAVLTNVAQMEFLINSVKDKNKVNIPVQLFPNPVKNAVNIAAKWPVSTQKIKVEILDIHGTIVQHEEISVNGQYVETTLNVAQLPTGVYQIRLFENEYVVTRQVVKVE